MWPGFLVLHAYDGCIIADPRVTAGASDCVTGGRVLSSCATFYENLRDDAFQMVMVDLHVLAYKCVMLGSDASSTVCVYMGSRSAVFCVTPWVAVTINC